MLAKNAFIRKIFKILCSGGGVCSEQIWNPSTGSPRRPQSGSRPAALIEPQPFFYASLLTERRGRTGAGLPSSHQTRPGRSRLPTGKAGTDRISFLQLQHRFLFYYRWLRWQEGGETRNCQPMKRLRVDESSQLFCFVNWCIVCKLERLSCREDSWPVKQVGRHKLRLCCRTTFNMRPPCSLAGVWLGC